MSDPTLTNLRSLLAAYTGRDAGSIELTDTLGSYGIDSLEHIQLILDVEEQFEIVIPEDDGPLIVTVAGLYDAILRAQDIAASYQPAMTYHNCGSGLDYGICRRCQKPHGHKIAI